MPTPTVEFFWEKLNTLLLFSLLMSELATILPLRHSRFRVELLSAKLLDRQYLA